MFSSLFRRPSAPAVAAAPRRSPGAVQPSVKKFKNAQANAARPRGKHQEERDSAKGAAPQGKKGKKELAGDAGAEAGDGPPSGLNRLERKRLRRKDRKKELKDMAREQKAAKQAEEGRGGGGGAPPERRKQKQPAGGGAASGGEAASQEKKRGKRKKGKLQAAAEESRPNKARKVEAGDAPLLLSAAGGSGTALGRAATRLQGSRFRWLNQTLYTTTGAEAKDLFEKDSTLAQAYHEGFTAQRAKWPRDPLLDVIEWIRREVPATSVVGDFGCGEARIAAALPKRTVHSFDLVRVNERVTPCNLADVPLKDGTLDVVVFCLALMGTDWLKFLREAHRCLRPGGLCHIVEVESRFKDFGTVVSSIQGLGFRLVLDKPGSFFVEFRFEKDCGSGSGAKRKQKKNAAGKALKGTGLGACTYRKR